MFEKFDRKAIVEAISYLIAVCEDGDLDRIRQVLVEVEELLKQAGLNADEVKFVLAMEARNDLLSFADLHPPDGRVVVDLSNIRRKFKRLYRLSDKEKFLYELKRELVFEG